MTSQTVAHRRILTAHQMNRCCYCTCELLPAGKKYGKAPHPRSATTEHLRRKVEGGSDAIGNKAVACHECNTGRGSTDWLTYKSLKMGELAA